MTTLHKFFYSHFKKITEDKFMLAVALVVWVFVVGIGWFMISRYENTPGYVETSPAAWPSASTIARSPDLPTLLMFVHPHCPCSRASVGELSSLMTSVQKRVRTQVIFVKPKEFKEEWVKTDLWNSAVRIPGVEARVDDLGKEAKLFRVNTSGQVMLYDTQGKLMFSGGITSSRGHAGDNNGRDAIVSYLTQRTLLVKHTPFFGCLLFDKP